jgi:hypothetical protein
LNGLPVSGLLLNCLAAVVISAATPALSDWSVGGHNNAFGSTPEGWCCNKDRFDVLVNTMISASKGYTGQVAKLIDAGAKVGGGLSAISSARFAQLY